MLEGMVLGKLTQGTGNAHGGQSKCCELHFEVFLKIQVSGNECEGWN
jgi:hypothetical protein